MPSFLKDLNITEVSLVPAGANQHARISLFKSKENPVDIQKIITSIQKADPKLFSDVVQQDERWDKQWKLVDGLHDKIYQLQESINSIYNSDSSDKEAKARESVTQFMSAVGMSVGEMTTMINKAERKTKSEIIGGKSVKFYASDYAYVPDPQKSSTWKLRLTNTPGGKPDTRIVGAAVAALGKGFRGQKVQIPAKDLPKVKRKVRAAWLEANKDKTRDDLPEILKVNTEASMPNLLNLTAIDDAVSKAVDGVGNDGDVTTAVLNVLTPVLEKANTTHAGVEKANEELKQTVEKGLNDEIFVDVEGNTIKKSVVGEPIFKSMKAMDTQLKKAKEDAAINKAATDAQAKYPNIAMDPIEKGTILYHLDKMPESVQKGIEKLLTSANENLANITKNRGYSGGGEGDNTPQSELRKALQADGAIKG